MKRKMKRSEDEWKTCLTPQQYKVLRKKGTDLPFTGKYTNNKKKGVYVCAGCGSKLFLSDTKFDSHTGWPSFYDAEKENIEMKPDRSFFIKQTEVLCKKCGGHLGHVYNDGPEPTGKRFCINSAALSFKENRAKKK